LTEPKLIDYSQSDLPALLNLVSIVMNRLNHLWNFYAVLNFAIGGWLFSANTLWSYKQKFIVTLVYGVAVSVSFVSIRRGYTWLGHVLREVNVAATSLQTHTDDFKTSLITISTKPSEVTLAGHFVIDCFVVFLIWKIK
jgi:hypothetical protein